MATAKISKNEFNEFRRFEDTCYQTDRSKIPPAKTGVKNS